ncbi:MAG TPA: ABC transporter ATP-binding protein [Thermoclostridium caenicola]|uniref:ABC transporter ATP-binding protein n=1 Tax=Thermoclostridium caenicola TaxID=659425 RepID=UPI002BF6EECC|nr:ABC transporter ATP-binding protein [Thermoclostridium caenicola]HOL84323.1 ABC transporter ATP-binding protein [Thermoclostridium caenicola]HPO76633.1 ABC transporter ATP-binding protein [Thermoclostridium caenicola]
MRTPIVEFRNFSFRYKSQSEPTLHDINLTIYKGEKVLILGPSGSGKSTLANCINGLNPFSYDGVITGSCKVAGMETKNASIFALSKVVGTVLQDSDAQFVGLSVGEDIAFALENQSVPRKEMLPKVEWAAGVVGMSDFLMHVPYELSGGQKQKVALAGVLHGDVDLLIFDEPLASLDPMMGMTAVELIDRIHKEQNKTVLIVEHRLEDVLHRSVDRIVLMNEGSIVYDGDPDRLLASDLLTRYGIREPLYIKALQYAGCELSSEQKLADIQTVDLSPFEERLKKQQMMKLEKYVPRLGEEILKVENVTFAYDKDPVLKNISFSVRKGEKIAVVGKNGAGKSTLAKLLCGIVRPREGRVLINGTDYTQYSIKEIGERIGYVMQNPNQMLVKDIIKDEVELAMLLRGKSRAEIDEAVKKTLKMCGLYPMRNWPVSAVSYGQKKRATIASILVLQPEIIILDEPTAGQDFRHYTEIMEFLDELNREYGITILFVTHDMHLAIQYTDRALVFSEGELVADDSVFRVLSNDEVITKANLKQTSLYTLARRLGFEPEAYIEHFINYERMVRVHGKQAAD